MHQKLHFRRFEFKYLLQPIQEAAIKEHIKRYMTLDPYVLETGNSAYTVASMYYDSPQFYYYHEKVDGVRKRKKIRLRTYWNNGAYSSYLFFEIKRKNDAVVSKDRFVLNMDEYHELLREGSFNHINFINDKNRGHIIEEFNFEYGMRALRPMLWIAYEREPYLGRYNKNVRITFDRNLRAMENDNLFYEGDAYSDVTHGAVIMEIKFNGALPRYLQDVIKAHNLSRVAYSKYCNGIDACASLSYPKRPTAAFHQNNQLANQALLWETF